MMSQELARTIVAEREREIASRLRNAGLPSDRTPARHEIRRGPKR